MDQSMRDMAAAAGLSEDLINTAAAGHDSAKSTMSTSAQDDDSITNHENEVNSTATQHTDGVDLGDNDVKQGFEKFGFKNQEDFENGYKSLLEKMSRGEHKQEPQGAELGAEQASNNENATDDEVKDIDELSISDTPDEPDTNVAGISFESLQAEINENGKINDDTRKTIEEGLEKLGLPKEMLSDYEASKTQLANNRAKEISAVFGEDQSAILTWAREARGKSAEVNTIVESYNKAVKQKDIDSAKSFASILKNYHSNANRKPVNITPNGDKKRQEVPVYNSEADLQADIAAGADMNTLISKLVNSKNKK